MLELEARLADSVDEVFVMSLLVELDDFLSLSSSTTDVCAHKGATFLPSNDSEFQISGGTCAIFHILAVLDAGGISSSSGTEES
jgi:hypothetical protein